MKRLALGVGAAVLCMLAALGPTRSTAQDPRTLPMRFQLLQDAGGCEPKCNAWVAATGAITAETPREFESFTKRNDVRGLTIALDSDGGSVLGALALGRSIRQLRMTTTVGKTVEVPNAGDKRFRLNPRAYCESMCAFVLLAGVERFVPPEARVLVHQIWLGDRRDDPTAANYSAEDLVLVQRDIGRLAQYTVEMGGTIDLLEMALKIPPWEPMRLLSRDELRGMKVVTAAATDATGETNSGPAAARPALANGARTAAVNDRSWTLADNSGRPTLSRRHPLTVEGEDIGTFEVALGCADDGRDFSISYSEQRRIGEGGRLPKMVTDVELYMLGKSVTLKVMSSAQNGASKDFVSTASGKLPGDLLKAFANTTNRSITIETTSEDVVTTIRVGNAGVARNFLQLANACGTELRTRSTELRQAN